MDVQFSFLITAGGLRVLLASGVREEPQVEVDVLLVGADANREQLAAILDATQPRCVLPNHWDDMFRPLSGNARPMMSPPTVLIPTFRRVNLQAFARTVRELRPGCEVILPDLCKPYRMVCPN
jgi:hypothetical protein